MSTTPTLQPVADGDRIQALDVLRGFALLGVFLMNIEWFSRPLGQMGTGLDLSGGAFDDAAAWAVAWLAQGKFWALFSLLFGMGFTVMSMRADAAGRGFYGPYLRRIAALALFGAAHAVFFWVGDILFTYAMTALVLLGLRALQRAAMPQAPLVLRPVAAMVIWFGITALMALSALFMPVTPSGGTGLAMFDALTEAAPAVYAGGDWFAVTAHRLREWSLMTVIGVFFIVPMALAMFLLGGWLMRSGRMRDPAAHRGFFIRLAVIGLPLGLVLAWFATSMLAGAPPGGSSRASTLAAALGFPASLALMLGYVGAVTLASLSARLGPLLGRWLAPAGRMALTHYLLQSVIASTLFYGYGLGLYGEVGRGGQTLLVLVVFALQLLASRWWLARFRYGPMEWLWRAVTYLRLPPMRR